MTDPIRLARPDVGDAELAAVAEVVGTGQLTMGPKVGEFEAAIADAVGTAHAAAVSSGTAALHLALLALEIGHGDEVIVPAYTFPATANAVELCGAKAVLVDIDADTFNLDVAAVAAAVTPALLGSDPDVERLRLRIGGEFVDRFRAALGEDADPAVLETLALAFSGALLQCGMGLMTYTEMADRLDSVVAVIMKGNS